MDRDEFHTLSAGETARLFGTDTHAGLTAEQAHEALQEAGPNSLGDDSSVDYKSIVIHQVCNAMILVLFISMCISFAIRDWITGGVITFVVGVNVVIGVYQEIKATKTMNSLRQLSSPTARITRNGQLDEIPSKDVVPGDLCTVKVGDTIPADLRLISASNFETDEALLTGESLPVSKDPELTYEPDTPVGDRLNIAFASSNVVKGRAEGIVIKTGLQTEIGKIAKSLRGEEGLISKDPSKTWYENAWITTKQTSGAFLGTTTGTPLHRKLSKLAVLLFWIAVVFAIVVMATQKFDVDRGVAIYAVCVALSMIPSSLVVVLTITMSVGASVMASRHVLVRKLDSLESLGAVNDICSDKTGTLTQGKMIAKQIWIPQFGTITVTDSNEPMNPTVGQINLIPKFSPLSYTHNETEDVGIRQNFKDLYQKGELNDLNVSLFTQWLHIATLANIAHVFQDQETGEWKAHGDPTEIAIQVFACRLDLPRHDLTGEKDKENTNNERDFSLESQNGRNDNDENILDEKDYPFQHYVEYPFDSTIKRMSAVYHNNTENSYQVFSKGAFESVLSCCNKWYGEEANPDGGNEAIPLTEKDLETIRENVDTLSKEGLRVLAFAQKSFSDSETTDELKEELLKNRAFVESELVFCGLIGIYDPPRPETEGAVKKFHRAGINVRMLTGDFPGTAKAIAQEVGILPHNLFHYPQEVVDIMVMTGTQFDDLSAEEIDNLPVLPLVIARCSPQTKVRMIEALHRRGKFCAMTGDGVNDSPSLKLSNVGIAMGLNGSDVAKDASDIVLSDDNFASILNAVEEGRRMSDNIQKFVLQLLAENVAQALYLIVGLAFFDDDHKSVFPLSPVEVLWIIVITSCFPAMGLGLEKAAPNLMERRPNDSKAGIFTWEIIVDMMVYGTLIAACCMGAFTSILFGKYSGELGRNCNREDSASCRDVYRARSAAFATMTWSALVLGWEVVNLRRSFFRMQPETDEPVRQFFRDIWSNQFLFWSIVLGFASAFPVVHIPVINDKVFLHGPIGWEWGIAFAFTAGFWIFAECYKYLKRVYYRKMDTKAQDPERDLEKKSGADPFEAYSTATTMQTEFNASIKF